MSGDRWIDWPLKHDKTVVIACLCAVAVGSWAYLLAGAGTGMSTFAMTSWNMATGALSHAATPMDWTPGYAATMAAMWWIMMIAMMLPSAAPVILLHAQIDRGTRSRSGVPVSLWPTVLFSAGYLSVWGMFSVLAAALQWGFEGAGLLSPFMMNGTSFVFAGLILLYAGAYQLSPLKQACLRQCQGPLQFLSRNWRDGLPGAFGMGVHHGAVCLGCCFGLMLILFFGGIMNLYWIVGLAVLVFLEKIIVPGPWLSRLTGILLIAWSFAFLAHAFD